MDKRLLIETILSFLMAAFNPIFLLLILLMILLKAKLSHLAIYLARCTLPFITFLFAVGAYITPHAPGHATHNMYFIGQLGQMDSYWCLFYRLIFASALIAAFSLPRIKVKWVGALFLAIPATLPAIIIFKTSRNCLSYLESPTVVLVITFYIYANVYAMMLRKFYFREWPGRIRHFLVDLFLPLGTWAIYNKRYGKKWLLLLPIPLSILWTAAAAPLYMNTTPDPIPANRFSFDRSVRIICNQINGYQFERTPGSNQVIVAGNYNKIFKYDIASGHMVSFAELPIKNFGIQGFGMDTTAKEIAFVDPFEGHTYFLDSETFKILRIVNIENPLKPNGGKNSAGRVLWNKESGLLFAFDFLTFCVQLSPEGDRIVWSANDLNFSLSADALIDPRHNEIHSIYWSGDVIALDAKTHKVVRRAKPNFPLERISLDETNDVLLVTAPTCGKVYGLDSTTYEPMTSISTMPGIRVATPDSASELLFLSGFAPYLEIRSLDDYSLIDRIKIPPWTRWSRYDPDKGKLYVMSGTYLGAFVEIDVRTLLKNRASPRTLLRRIDPFFIMMEILITKIDYIYGQ